MAFPREGLTSNASYKFLDRWSVDGSLILDMSRHYYDIPGQATTPVFFPVGYSFGFGYKDECTTLTIRYSSSTSAPAAYYATTGALVYNPTVHSQTLMFQLVLRTLGDVRANVGL